MRMRPYPVHTFILITNAHDSGHSRSGVAVPFAGHLENVIGMVGINLMLLGASTCDFVLAFHPAVDFGLSNSEAVDDAVKIWAVVAQDTRDDHVDVFARTV